MARTITDVWAMKIARLLVGGFFVVEGLAKLANFTSASSIADFAIVPMSAIVTICVAIAQIVLGFMVIIRFHSKLATLLLAAYVLVATLMLHVFGASDGHSYSQVIFYRDIALIGGLLYIHAHSRTYRYKLWKHRGVSDNLIEATLHTHIIADIGRILVGGYFLFQGLNRLVARPDILPLESITDDMGLFLIFLVAVFEGLLGVLIAAKYHTKVFTMPLIIYTAVTTIILHGDAVFMFGSLEQAVLLRDIAIVGALMSIYSCSRNHRDWWDRGIMSDPAKKRFDIDD